MTLKYYAPAFWLILQCCNPALPLSLALQLLGTLSYFERGTDWCSAGLLRLSDSLFAKAEGLEWCIWCYWTELLPFSHASFSRIRLWAALEASIWALNAESFLIYFQWTILFGQPFVILRLLADRFQSKVRSLVEAPSKPTFGSLLLFPRRSVWRQNRESCLSFSLHAESARVQMALWFLWLFDFPPSAHYK